jgi:hypothetical protein
MTIDELKQLAETLATRYDEYNGSTADAAVDLARAVLAMLPVVRAAEAWQQVESRPPLTKIGTRVEVNCVGRGLWDAVDEFRRVMGAK